MKNIIILSMLLLLISSIDLFAQCSDAGACAINGTEDDTGLSEKLYRVRASYVFGSSGKNDDLIFHSLLLKGNVQLFGSTRISLQLPLRTVDGPLGSTSGMGDLILLWDQGIWSRDGRELRVQAGGKIATGEDNDGGLPQAYQTGLGTDDILFGVSFDAAPWNLALGYQYSQGRSDNTVDRLKRGDDLLARAGYRTSLDVFALGLELIAVKRLSESSVRDTDTERENQFINVPDSDQLQVNVLGNVSAPISEALRLFIFAAVPLLQRDINIDGLKRSLTLSVGVELSL